MLYFEPWKIILIVGTCVLGVLFTLPNLFSKSTLESLPRWIPHPQISLGLDLQGGSHLLYEVDMNSMLREQLNNALDSVRTELVAAKIGYSQLEVQGDQIVIQLRDPASIENARAILQKIDPDFSVEVSPDGHATMTYNEAALEARKHKVIEQSIEVIRRRIDETGTKEPTIQREGEDRILVQLPGVDDPERMKALIGKTAKMTFQLVDLNADPQSGRAPPGDELLPSEEDKRNPNAQRSQYLVKRRVEVSGDMLTSATAAPGQGDQAGLWVVNFKLDSRGARAFQRVTSENIGKPFAIVLDGKVISAPVIRSEIRDQGQITGNFTAQSATDLALLLNAGALPARLTVIEERTVGPDLGADSIRAGTIASIVGMILVMVFMVLFYGLFGIYANVALIFNLCLMLACLSLLGATLTLPGIAGIALTTGMDVDANVLIYERIREEVRNGRTVLAALEAGFRRAFGTILDSHVTTLVAGALMFWLGSGPVKGFAVTLSIGVITSLFSAILVTRLQIVTWVRRRRPKAIPI
ncbi:MAG TPA: protein translocase subunit SecD [Stellaceae bacterium]|nr:protein translocase subunit SecD [Stellaceae bacterium]